MSDSDDDLDWGTVPSAFIDSLNAAAPVPVPALAPAPAPAAPAAAPAPVAGGGGGGSGRPAPSDEAAQKAQQQQEKIARALAAKRADASALLEFDADEADYAAADYAAADAARPAAPAPAPGPADTSFGAQVIKLLDTDSDGVVSEAELRAGIASGKLSDALGPPDQAAASARAVFAAFDANGDDTLDASELTAMAQRALAHQRDAAARSAVPTPEEHVTALAEVGDGVGMFRCLQDAGVTADLELAGQAPTVLRKYAAGDTFHVSEIRATTDGRERARAAEGGWVSLVSASGLQLIEAMGVGRFVCVAPAALITASLNGTGGGSDAVRRLGKGEAVASLGEAVSANGARRLKLQDGWVSVVNKKGVVLLQPASLMAQTKASAARSTSRVAEESLLSQAQQYVAQAASPVVYTAEEEAAAASRIQSRVRGNDARMAYLAKVDALTRSSPGTLQQPRSPRRRESVACINKLWHEMGSEARSAASALGWKADAWDHGVCPVKYWEQLSTQERKSARFLGFAQRSWDTLGVSESTAAAEAGTNTSHKPSVAACIEALCMLDPAFRETLASETTPVNAEEVDILLDEVERNKDSNHLAVESTELLKLLRIALGGEYEMADESTVTVKVPIHERLYQQPTKSPRLKGRQVRQRQLAKGTPPRVRKPMKASMHPAPLPRDNPFSSPATSKGFRTLYPDSDDIAHHNPIAGFGAPSVVKGLANYHADMDKPEHAHESVDHQSMLVPWRTEKVRRDPLRKDTAIKDAEQERLRKDCLKRRLRYVLLAFSFFKVIARLVMACCPEKQLRCRLS